MRKILLAVLALAVCSCYPEDSGLVTCRTVNGVFFNGNTDRCAEFQRHEDVLLEGYRKYTPQWSDDYRKSAMSGYSVNVRTEVKRDANGRAYWTDPDIQNFRIWGQTWCEKGQIDLADDNFKSGVLAHEFGHVFMRCGPFDHDYMPRNGVNDAISYVQRNYSPLTGATSSALTSADVPVEQPVLLTAPDGSLVIGVYERCE